MERMLQQRVQTLLTEWNQIIYYDSLTREILGIEEVEKKK